MQAVLPPAVMHSARAGGRRGRRSSCERVGGRRTARTVEAVAGGVARRLDSDGAEGALGQAGGKASAEVGAEGPGRQQENLQQASPPACLPAALS